MWDAKGKVAIVTGSATGVGEEVAVQLAEMGANVVINYTKSLDERLIRFMDSGRGRHKVLFGTNGLGLERCKREFLELDIGEDTKRAVLYDNVARFLKLDAD